MIGPAIKLGSNISTDCILYHLLTSLKNSEENGTRRTKMRILMLIMYLQSLALNRISNSALNQECQSNRGFNKGTLNNMHNKIQLVLIPPNKTTQSTEFQVFAFHICYCV